MTPYFREEIETLGRDALDALIDERVRYTVSYAATHSPFYRSWFAREGINPDHIRTHEDLLGIPVISGASIRENQPPEKSDFLFLSSGWDDIFTIHETSGTSGIPKSFFLTWDDWERYIEKYARIFTSQGFSRGDRAIVCTSYGMNVGASTMTLAAREVGFTVIPTGKCNFPLRMISGYRPTAIIGSVFKLIHLARRMSAEGQSPADSSVTKLVVGGESFAQESRDYCAELWDCGVFNTYGSTEGTMCGECAALTGLHVPEDLVHLDVYDPQLSDFVRDGECGRAILTTLLPPGHSSGMLLLNYDTEDTTVVVSRERCVCGRTHLRIHNPEREAETVWIRGTPVNRVDLERAVFQHQNMDYLTGEYEGFVYGGRDGGPESLQIVVECLDPLSCDRKLIEEVVVSTFLKRKPGLSKAIGEGMFEITVDFAGPAGLELYKMKGRPKRLTDRR
jgi:coenzyme F390 synthetase